MKKLSKKEHTKSILEINGQISNIRVLNGSYGFRTNRLGAIIHELRKDGMNIETKELFYQNGEYKNCIYILKD